MPSLAVGAGGFGRGFSPRARAAEWNVPISPIALPLALPAFTRDIREPETEMDERQFVPECPRANANATHEIQ